MPALRTFFRTRHRLALVIVALALAMKALVPGGYMIGQQGKVLTVSICADASGAKMTKQIVLPQTGHSDDHAKSDGACPYAALGIAALSGADTVLLAIALGFIMALGFASVPAIRQAGTLRLRPPLRGPPAQA
jgi:hypothetical protein